MALVRSGDANYDAIYGKWQGEDYAGWVTYAGVQYRKMVDVAGVIAFEPFTTTALLDSRSLSDSKPATYSKLDDGGHNV
jgi:hypothetical protein